MKYIWFFFFTQSKDCGKSELTLTFAEIEEIIGCSLCKSDYNYLAYWNLYPTHTMPNTILAAGYKIAKIDLFAQNVLIQKI